MAASSPVKVEGLTKTFDELTAVDHFTFEAGVGEIVGLIGPSGSGKTTAVRLMTGSYRPTEGSIEIWGEDPSELSRAQKRKIGYLPQLAALLPELSIRENLQFQASLLGVPFRRKRRLEDALALVGLVEHQKTKVKNASGGMRRRLALAASLLHEPTLIFLDEPTAGIDPVLRQDIWGHLSGLREEGRTLIVTTQYVGEARYCDRVAVLVEGRLVAFDTPTGLRHGVYGGDVLRVEFASNVPPDALAAIEALPNVRSEPTVTGARTVSVVVDEGGPAIAAVSQLLADRGHQVVSVDERFIDFDAMFVELIEQSQSEAT